MTRKLGARQRRIKKERQRLRKPGHQFGYMPTAHSTRVTGVDYLEGADIDTMPCSLRHAYGYDGDDE